MTKISVRVNADSNVIFVDHFKEFGTTTYMFDTLVEAEREAKKLAKNPNTIKINIWS